MDIDVSAVTSHFSNPQDGFTTTTSGSVSSGATIVPLSSTGNYDNGDVVVLIIDPTDSNKKQVFTGIIDISGSQVTGVKWVGGTNQAHSSGATIVDYYDAAHIKMITKGLRVEHGQDGTHDATKVALLASTQTFTGNKTFNGNTTFSSIPVSPNPYKFSVYRNAAFNITNAFAKVTFDTELFDSNGNFATGTYTAPVAGFYWFNWLVGVPISGTTDNVAALYKNGAIFAWGNETAAGGSGGSLLIELAANDTIEIYVVGTATVAANVGSAPIRTYLSGYLVSQT